jgi:DNA-binding transcriptional ArsR family regulator
LPRRWVCFGPRTACAGLGHSVDGKWVPADMHHGELLVLQLVAQFEDLKVMKVIHDQALTEDTPKGKAFCELSASFHSECDYAEKSGYSVRQVGNLLRALEAKGYIDVWPRRGSKVPRRRVNRGRLQILLTLRDERVAMRAKTKRDIEQVSIEDAIAEGQELRDREAEYVDGLD